MSGVRPEGDPPVTYLAHAVNVRAEISTSRKFENAETAARNLEVLLRADGWPLEKEETVRQLLAGKTLAHKNFSYRVAEEE
jgi:hypothetical protein